MLVVAADYGGFDFMQADAGVALLQVQGEVVHNLPGSPELCRALRYGDFVVAQLQQVFHRGQAFAGKILHQGSAAGLLLGGVVGQRGLHAAALTAAGGLWAAPLAAFACIGVVRAQRFLAVVFPDEGESQFFRRISYSSHSAADCRRAPPYVKPFVMPDTLPTMCLLT